MINQKKAPEIINKVLYVPERLVEVETLQNNKFSISISIDETNITDE